MWKEKIISVPMNTTESDFKKEINVGDGKIGTMDYITVYNVLGGN